MPEAVRVYVPATLDDLAGFVAAGVVPVGQERFLAGGADEESEHATLMAAADAAAALGARRRVVVVAEVADADAEVPMERVVAVHADTEDDVDPDTEPGWFATQEIPGLLG